MPKLKASLKHYRLDRQIFRVPLSCSKQDSHPLKQRAYQRLVTNTATTRTDCVQQKSISITHRHDNATDDIVRLAIYSVHRVRRTSEP